MDHDSEINIYTINGVPFKFKHFLQFHNTIRHTKLQDCGFSITTVSHLICISHYYTTKGLSLTPN